MGGAEDSPQRSSSPLKRRASDLEVEASLGQQDDVDMIQVPSSDLLSSTDAKVEIIHDTRSQSVDMLKDTPEIEEPVEEEASRTEIPSIDTQIKTVRTICEAAAERSFVDEQLAYLVSKSWLARVEARSSEALQARKENIEGELGPVDNSDIIQQIIKDHEGKDFIQLKDGLGSESFELFPEDAWNLVMEWYGLMPGSLPIIRHSHNTNPDKMGIPNIAFEFHPPIFAIHRLWSDSTTELLPQLIKAQNPAAPIFVLSRSIGYNVFLKSIKQAANIDLTRKVRVWRVPRSLPTAESTSLPLNATTPPYSQPASPVVESASGGKNEAQDSWTDLLLDVASFSQLTKGEERELVDFPDNTNNPNYNGHMDLATAGLGDNQAIVLDEHVSGDNYVMNYVSKGSKPSTALTGRPNVSNVSLTQSNSGRNSPAPSGPVTRGRAQRSGRTIGTAGLSNLGNTCYMNSALQCVRSVEELTKYFLTGAALKELNCENPLGNNGEVAVAYNKLLEELYKEPVPTSFSPRYFKATIGRYAPAFSGYGQQDSQEFLGFLLDGLQEDLSRVKKKPYIEKPDSTDEMVNNQAAIREMADKVWDITKKRDDSVIADLFTGMYKSTLVCPTCAKVSITFDPFNNLTLQLPIESSWTHDIQYFPLNDKPLIIPVDLDKQGSIMSMKEYVGKKVGVAADKLFAAEVFKGKFYKTYDDYKPASEEIGINDIVRIFELDAKPTNWPPPPKSVKKQKAKSLMPLNFGDSDSEDSPPSWGSPFTETLLVPVFHRHPSQERVRYKRQTSWTLLDVPHFITVTTKEARDEELIHRKILEKIATLSTHPIFTEDEDTTASVAESIDPDMILTTSSDADSSSDSKIVAHSVDGEEGLVDVTMNDPIAPCKTTEHGELGTKMAEEQASKPGISFNKRRPKFMAPDSYLVPELQNMFTLGFFGGSEQWVPTGWNTVNEEVSYQTLSSRNPRVDETISDESGQDFEMANGRTGSESSTEDGGTNEESLTGATRMADESSDEDELNHTVVPRVSQKTLPVRPAGPKPGVRVVGGSRVNNRRRKGGMKTYSKKENRMARKLADNPSPTTEQSPPDDGPLIRLGEGIVVDWTEPAYEAFFCAEGANDNFRGMPTFKSIDVYHDTELIAKRAARSQRRKNGITLDDCLNEFGKEEILSEMDTWYCPRCKEHRRASKKFELWKTPDILIMHLKRFSSSATRRDKLDVLVDFPIEGLDLTARVVENQEGKKELYDLIAVDDHWGGLGGGHYTAFAKSFIDAEWYEYNDSSVSKLKDVSRIVTASAYLLFYRRRSEEPLGGPRFKQIFQDYENRLEISGDETESGEAKGLVGNSSLRGSSSALTGVGAAHRQLGPGLGHGGQMTTLDPQMVEELPSYEEHLQEEDATPLLFSDAEMTEGLPIHDSIEDEGIDMSMGYNSIGLNSGRSLLGTWNFDGLSQKESSQVFSEAGSDLRSEPSLDLDDRSDIVQHDSSASDASVEARLAEFNNSVPEGADEYGNFIDPSPVPDIDDDEQMDTLALHKDIMTMHAAKADAQPSLRSEPNIQITAAEQDEEDEEPATEIHVEEGEGLKID